MFPELRPYLEEVFEQAEPGTEFVITRYRNRNSNLRTQLERIISKAGLKTWPKLFQNLRASRETELAEHWPEHVVCAWIGNSRLVARKHYLQVTEEHFEQAAIITTAGKKQAAQNPAQKAAVLSRTDSQGDSEGTEDQQELQEVAARCEFVPEPLITRPGLERSENPPGITHISSTGGAESGARGGECESADPELAEVVKAWPKLLPRATGRHQDNHPRGLSRDEPHLLLGDFGVAIRNRMPITSRYFVRPHSLLDRQT